MKINKLEFMPFVNRMITFIDVSEPDKVDKKALAKDIFEDNKDQFKGYFYATFLFRVSKKNKGEVQPENSISFFIGTENTKELLVNEKYNGSRGTSRKSRAVKAQQVKEGC